MGFTAKKAIRLAMIGGAIAATAALSACSGNAAGNSSPVKNAADAAAQHSPQGAATGGSGGSANAKGGDFTDANGNVNCSKLSGKHVSPPGGPQLDLFADTATTGSNPGCDTAFNVITEYYKEIPTKGEGPGKRVLDIFGDWTCAGQADAANPDGTVCGKGATDYMIETRPAGQDGAAAPAPQQRRFPNTTQKVQFTGFDTSVNMATFQLVSLQPGGPDGGHYDRVDEKTYRLPLAGGAIVWSAATLCQNDNQVTIDDKGLGNFRCDADQLRQTLLGGAASPALAQILVSGDDQIAEVKEIYHP
ncbi:hypothetical protein [Amycolatopsis saalfeldensis]|uniref:PknH-like extracellular domain-containing protein n=1 Tax=Amycolatopsis saalfeldensis TaxID=394193 RepID=A0A1H8YD06_9PSEU|nr:hypothetical protein [Amycolatopsis saalfeldensis]SEP49962.1 hypothetical protein SAMN04489732_113277 [Amycolatopsis saalfeldensis]